MEALYLFAGIILGWTLRWERDKKLVKQFKQELIDLKKMIERLLGHSLDEPIIKSKK